MVIILNPDTNLDPRQETVSIMYLTFASITNLQSANNLSLAKLK